jgi:hypothetical protein
MESSELQFWPHKMRLCRKKYTLTDSDAFGGNGMIVLDTVFLVLGYWNAVHIKAMANSQNLNDIRDNCAVGVS